MHISSQLAHKFVRICILGFLVFLLIACGTGGNTGSPRTSKATSPRGGSQQPSSQPAGQITGFSLPRANSSTQNSFPIAITSGPDNNLWFTEARLSTNQSQADQSLIGCVTADGKIKEFLLPTTDTLLTGITKGPDGKLWFTEGSDINAGSIPSYSGKIGYITPDGQINEFLLPTTNNDPLTITSGPDGNLWFTDLGTGQIGRISPHGKLTEFPLPANSNPIGITAGPDGNLWFTEGGGKIGRITPVGTTTIFSLPTASSVPAMITSGPDGNLWFTETSWDGPNISSKIGRITPTGTITIFSVPNAQGYSQGGGGYLYSIGFGPLSITKGSDGNLWFTGIFKKNMVGRITPSGVVTEFFLSGSNGVSYGISSGSDGNLWFTASNSNGGQIGRITTGSAPAQPHATSTASTGPSLGSPYQGDGYTITPLVGWQVQPNSFGVVFSDPRFPMVIGKRAASHLGVANDDPLFLEYGSSFRLRCQNIGGVPTTTTLAGVVWDQFQYRCSSFQQGGVASQIRVLSTTHGADQKYIAIYYLTDADRLDDFSNGSFATMAQTFTFS